MKKLFYMLGFLLAAITSQADNVFSVDDIEMKPGETKVISVSLTNDGDAASAAIDITLPSGLSFVKDQGSTYDGTTVFSDRTTGISMKNAKIQTSGALRVGLAIGSIPAGTGELFTFKVKADENATEGTVKISYTNQSLTIGSKVTIPDMQSNVTIIKEYAVTVAPNNVNYGTVATNPSGQATYPSGTSMTLTATPAQGYKFVNWTSGENELSKDNPYEFTVSDDANIVGNFAVNQYTITFDSKGGSEVAPIIADYGATITAPQAPTKDGYSFAGWNPAMPETMPVGGAALEATWTPVEYTLTYNLDGGAVETANPTSYTIESEAITLNNPTKEGYTFAGWTGTGIEQATAEVTIAKGSTGNREYTATWNVNQYTMTFVLGNGEENIVKVQDFGSELTAPADPKWEEHNFLGWNPEVPQTVPASDATFTAQWDVIKYKLTFINGELIIKQEELEKGAPIVAPNEPTKDGYTFAGWNPELAATMPSNDVTYTATWTPIEYTITYNLDGGAVATANPEKYTIESKDITLNNPTKEGYTFEGWTGTDVQVATLSVTIKQGSIGNREYTANWKLIEVDPIEEKATVDISTLSDENLQNNVVDDVYYNLSEGAYDSSDKSVVIGQSTDMQQITDKTPGSNDISSKFNGIILNIGTGYGEITVNTKTSGNASIAIQIGNNAPTTAQKTEKGDVTVNYEVTEDTYVYIYSLTGNSTNGLSITGTEDVVKIYNITVSPGTTGIKTIGGVNKKKIESIYDLGGRKMQGTPNKSGIYVIDGMTVAF